MKKIGYYLDKSLDFINFGYQDFFIFLYINSFEGSLEVIDFCCLGNNFFLLVDYCIF